MDKSISIECSLQFNKPNPHSLVHAMFWVDRLTPSLPRDLPAHPPTHHHPTRAVRFFADPPSLINLRDNPRQHITGRLLIFPSSSHCPLHSKMSFAIEVPGEAIPLSLNELGRALQAATSSSDHAQRQSAGQQLTAWESHKDFYPSLQVWDLTASIIVACA